MLAHGTGALNIDASRVGTDVITAHGGGVNGSGRTYGMGAGIPALTAGANEHVGRWPANVVLSHAMTEDGGDACAEGCVPGCPVAELDQQAGVLTSGANPTRRGSDKFRDAYGEFAGQREIVPNRGTDTGGASRFFPVFRYEAKAPSRERPRVGGIGAATHANRCAKCGRQDLSGSRCQCPEPEWIPRDDAVVAHPTVKPLALMQWLVRLVTPPGGTVLDPFAGSGTTGEACMIEGFACTLIELDPTHLPLIVKRLTKSIQPTLGF